MKDNIQPSPEELRLSELTSKVSEGSLSDEEQTELFQLTISLMPRNREAGQETDIRLVSRLSDNPNYRPRGRNIEELIDEELNK